MVLVCLRIYAFQASEPLSLPPPVSFSPPKAPPISAPEVPILMLSILSFAVVVAGVLLYRQRN